MLRIICFAVVCVVGAVSVQALGMSPEWTMLTYGIGVIVVSQLFVPLCGSKVDAIYYALAVVGAGLVFVAQTSERAINEKGVEHQEAKNVFDRAEAVLAEHQSQKARLEEAQQAATQSRAQAEAALEAENFADLAAQEADLAVELATVVFASPAADDVRARAANCRDVVIPDALDARAEAVASQTTRDNQLSLDDGLADDGFEVEELQGFDLIAIEIGALDGKIDDCTRDIARALPLERDAATVTTFAALAGMREELGEVGAPSGPPDFSTVAGRTLDYGQTVLLVLDYLASKRQLVSANARASGLEADLARTATEIAAAETEVAERGKKLKDAKTSLDEAIASPTSVAAHTATDILLNHWPFFLIGLLGLKLGRNYMWAKSDEDAQTGPRS